MSNEGLIPMPKYKCHKEVWALKIAAITHDDKFPDGDYDAGDREEPGATITPEDAGYAPFRVSAEYMRKHRPEVGGFFVVYEDGYSSYSPGAAFESGYTRIEPPARAHRAASSSTPEPNMNIEMKQAIEKAITENLTGAMAGELKTFLEQAEQTKAAHEKLQKDYDYLQDENKQLRRAVELRRNLDGEREDIRKQREELAARELKLAHDTAANAVAVAQAELKGYREVTDLVFRNMAVHNSITRSVGIPVEGAPGGNGYVGTMGMVVQTTETEATSSTQG